MSDLSARTIKSQCAVAAASGNIIIEDILRDIFHDRKIYIHAIQFYMKVEANAILHEIILCRNRSTSPGPSEAPAEAVQLEGCFFEFATYTSGEYDVFYNFPKPIFYDKDDSINLRFDWGTQGAGNNATFEVTLLYTVDKP